MNSIESVFTRVASNEGADVTIPGTTDTLKIRGVDSDHFAKGRAKRSRESARILGLPEEERDAAIDEADKEFLVDLVVGWSFSEEPTRENISKLFTEAPWIKEFVNKQCVNRKLFFKRS